MSNPAIIDAFRLPPVPGLALSDVEKKIDAAVAAGETPTLTEEEQADLYAKASGLKQLIADATEKLEEVKERFRVLDYGTTTVHPDADGKVTIGRNPVFNEAKFLVDFPYNHREVRKVVRQDEQGNDVIKEEVVYPNREMYQLKVDRTAARGVLSKEVFDDEYMDEGTKKVTIK